MLGAFTLVVVGQREDRHDECLKRGVVEAAVPQDPFRTRRAGVVSAQGPDRCERGGGAQPRVVFPGRLFVLVVAGPVAAETPLVDRKSTRLNSSHLGISYAVF